LHIDSAGTPAQLGKHQDLVYQDELIRLF
jgi:hypothetical protein